MAVENLDMTKRLDPVVGQCNHEWWPLKGKKGRRCTRCGSTSTGKMRLLPEGPPPLPAMNSSHDVRHLVVCAYARCRQLGDEREMVVLDKSTEFQSRADGAACYHGRCYIRRFGWLAFIQLSQKQINKLTLGDLGPKIMKALMR